MKEKKKESKIKKNVEALGSWVKKNSNAIIWGGISCVALYDVYKLGQLTGIRKFILEGDAEIASVMDETQGNVIGIRTSYGIFSGLKCFSKEYTQNVVIPLIEDVKE